MQQCWTPLPWSGFCAPFFLTCLPYIIKTESPVNSPDEKMTSGTNSISIASSARPPSLVLPQISNAKQLSSMSHQISNESRRTSQHSASHPTSSTKRPCPKLNPSVKDAKLPSPISHHTSNVNEVRSPSLKPHVIARCSGKEANGTSCCESCTCDCSQPSTSLDASGSEIGSEFLRSSFMEMLPEDISDVINDNHYKLEGTHTLLEDLKAAMKLFVDNLFVAKGYKEVMESEIVKGNELLPAHMEEYKKYKRIANAYFQKYNNIQGQIDSNIQLLKLPETSNQYVSTTDSELEGKTEIDSVFLRSSFLDVLPDNEMISHIYEKLMKECDNMHTLLEDLEEAMKLFIHYILVSKGYKEVIESESMAGNEFMSLNMKEYQKFKRNANLYRRKYNNLRKEIASNVELLKELQAVESKMQTRV